MREESDLLIFYEQAKEIMLKLGYDKDRLNGTVKLNNRLRSSLGRCFYNKKLIEIQAEYFYHATDDSIMNTILHELAHQINTHNDKHGYYWKQIAENISSNTKYKIERCATKDELNYKKSLVGHETFKCVDCGLEFTVRLTKKKTISNIQTNYYCGKCKGKIKTY